MLSPLNQARADLYVRLRKNGVSRAATFGVVYDTFPHVKVEPVNIGGLKYCKNLVDTIWAFQISSENMAKINAIKYLRDEMRKVQSDQSSAGFIEAERKALIKWADEYDKYHREDNETEDNEKDNWCRARKHFDGLHQLRNKLMDSSSYGNGADLDVNPYAMHINYAVRDRLDEQTLSRCGNTQCKWCYTQ